MGTNLKTENWLSFTRPTLFFGGFCGVMWSEGTVKLNEQFFLYFDQFKYSSYFTFCWDEGAVKSILKKNLNFEQSQKDFEQNQKNFKQSQKDFERNQKDFEQSQRDFEQNQEILNKLSNLFILDFMFSSKFKLCDQLKKFQSHAMSQMF